MPIRIREIDVDIVQGAASFAFPLDEETARTAILTEAAGPEPGAEGAQGPVVLTAGVAGQGVEPDEDGIRSAYRHALERCETDGIARLALPVIGRDSAFPFAASVKIWTQEVLRHARKPRPGLRRIALCEPDASRFAVMEKAATGYIRHFLDVLCWGPMPTVDVIIEVPGGIVLIKRSNPPYGWALPGGFVDYGENLETAAAREAKEETGLDVEGLRQFRTYSDPNRDARFHTMSTVFTGKARGVPRAADDAAEARVVPFAEIPALRLAFDHGRMLADWAASRGKGA